ncbi:hypothetical protein M501DRAFT_1001317 [Patellaria atrata CBS 101060]|uniref:Uncharacterized protein n=1 Tax=Patellaria atrata CBS 101060 TaxID=1346257 RepID=A0A9P4S149_9PEZI|nr:hypothetical protein M501DRAFT_1001317 [Patellaria atrata CBS 101060]
MSFIRPAYRVALKPTFTCACTLSRSPARSFTAIRASGLELQTPLYTSNRYPNPEQRQFHLPRFSRQFASKTTADDVVEQIQELYATARDEFEFAAEETENNTVYAADDRTAAREELEKLLSTYKSIVDGPDLDLAEQVKKRVGHRIRELQNAVTAMEELAQNQD